MIAQAEEKDLIEIMFVYKACVADMNASGLFNWNTAYPGQHDVLADIRKGDLYLYREHNATLGVVCINHEQPDEYGDLNWKYKGPFLVVHRLAVHPAFRNRDIGGKMMKFAHELARDKGYSAIRLDVIMVNPPALKLYQKAGFENVGTIHFAYQKHPFMCMEMKTATDQK
ncbi:MAG TPA: GNAT family N-acetyltransferase [Bacteroidales bacterium]|nr:GNAT family N-acetyltransferase [Bacteroidales bacterium]